MTLSDLAAGIEVTAEQVDRGVAAVDDTGADLVERLAAAADTDTADAGRRDHGGVLPCTPEAAATVVETHAAGASVGASAREAGIAPVAAAKVLHRCGVPGVSPLSPMGRRLVRDWLAGELARTDALALSGADEVEFALGAYIETHDPDDDLVAAVEGVFEPRTRASVEKAAELDGCLGETTDFL